MGGNMSGNQEFKINSNKLNDNQFYAEVSVWDPDVKEGRCGHASVKVYKSGEKKKETYLGSWPKYPSLVNLFTLPFPSPIKHLKSKEECMVRESSEDDKKLTPSRTFTIPLTQENYGAMKAKAASLKAQGKSGFGLYSLFANANVLNLVRAISKPSVVRQTYGVCPMSGLPIENPELENDIAGIRKFKVGHCSTTVEKVLKAGGVNIISSRLSPWRISPLGLANQLERMAAINPNIQVERGVCQLVAV